MDLGEAIDLSIGSLLRMQARGLLVQQMYPGGQIEVVEQSPRVSFAMNGMKHTRFMGNLEVLSK